MKNTENLDDFGNSRRTPEAEKTHIEPDGAGCCSGGKASSHGNVCGEGRENALDFGNNRGHTRYDWRTHTERPGNGDCGGDYIPGHPHSHRAVRAMGVVDDVLWWGVWGLRLALAGVIISILFGLFDGYALLKAPL
jgi:hypothetical protein